MDQVSSSDAKARAMQLHPVGGVHHRPSNTVTANENKSSGMNLTLLGTSKNRRERQQFRPRSVVVLASSEHRRAKMQRAAGFSRCPSGGHQKKRKCWS